MRADLHQHRKSLPLSPAADCYRSPATLLLEDDPDRRKLNETAAQLAEIRREIQHHIDRIVVLDQMQAEYERRYRSVWRRLSDRRPRGDAA